jgi:lipopolysaccharide export system permease protein
MNLVERYLSKALITYTLAVIFVLLIVLGFLEFMMQLGKITEQYTLSKGLLYTLLKLPVYGYEIFPIAILIGALLGLGALANHGELTVLRVTGWSIKRIFLGVMKSVFILWILVTIIGEAIAPKAEAYAKKIRGEALNKDFSIGSKHSLWMKEENRFIFVGKTISATKLLDIKIYFLNNNEITKIIYAKSAEYKNNKWLLSDLITSNFGWQDKQINASKEYKWQALTYQKHAQISQSITMPINPKLLQNLNLETRYMGIVDLHRYISFLTQNDLDAEPYRLEFWRKIASPLVIFGMIALVFPLIFGSQRQVSIGQRVFIGIIIGMGFHLLNQIFGNLSVVYNLSPVMGAFLPSIILIVIALVLMTRLR